MKKESARTYLENLVDRFVVDEASERFRLDGVISEYERQALLVALEILGGATHPSTLGGIDSGEASSVSRGKKVTLNVESLSFSAPQDLDTILCLDFGTAMSKAFATRSDDLQLLDLALGKRAGQAAPVYAIASSVYITSGGKILFGEKAIVESLNALDSGRRRLDSIKDFLSIGPQNELDETLLGKDFNPLVEKFSRGDIVTLFLGYLTDMAVTELVEKHKSSRYVRRRFARPVFPADRARWVDAQLNKLLARAQILADTFHGQWMQGLDAAEAKAAIDEIKVLKRVPTYLIDKGIAEPIAAIASRVRNYEPVEDKRRLFMILDVGAGTIDFGLFVEQEGKGRGVRMFEVPGSVRALRQAGDLVDGVLRRYILEKADISSRDPKFNLIDSVLSLNIRSYKEELFRNGEVEFRLENDMTGKVLRDEFLADKRVVEFQGQIFQYLIQSLEGVDEAYLREVGKGLLTLVFTGGGAGLPMVRALDKQTIVIRRCQLLCVASTLIPQWVQEEYRELELEYPQLAVAIGGSSRSLPEVAPDAYVSFGGLGDDGQWIIPPARKGI